MSLANTAESSASPPCLSGLTRKRALIPEAGSWGFFEPEYVRGSADFGNTSCAILMARNLKS